MNSNIRNLNYNDLSDFWEIVVLAGSEGYYPNGKEGRIGWFKKIMDECNDFTYFGAFQNEKLLGGMAIGDFKLNLRSSIINLSGVGMVHTDMLHKKEKICKDMIKYFIDVNKAKGTNLLFLSPFRPDFYKSMGFGYGTSLYNNRISPSSFPALGSKENHIMPLIMIGRSF
jgi:predicted acetyltransferase